LTPGQQPADRVAAEEIKDDVEAVVDAAVRASQQGDVPGPGLVRRGRHQLRALVGRMLALSPARRRLSALGQQPVQGPDAAVVFALLEQRGDDVLR